MALLTLSFLEISLGFILLALYFTFFRKQKHPKYPPGPPGLPLLGNLHQLGKRPQEAFLQWKKIYGDIYSVKLGMEDAVIVNDPKLIKELFSDVASSGRPQNPVFLTLSDGNHGVVNAEGEHWEEQRRFVLRTLRDFGFAKSSMEGIILEEANDVLNWFGKYAGKAVSCYRIFNAAVVNSLWSIVSGEREPCDIDVESEVMEKSHNLMKAINTSTQTGLLFAPFLRFLIPNLSGWTKLVEAGNDLKHFGGEAVTKHRKKLDRNCPNDLIDHYLLEMEKSKDPKSSFYKQIGEKNLQAVVIDLFEAGSETTSATLSWAMLYLCLNPGVQQKLIKEIHTVLGRSRSPTNSDKPNLPYTEAVIMEVLRLSTLLPMGVLHRMIEGKMFHGYFIPKGTNLIANVYAAHYDPAIWNDPENFRPERFLSEDGTKVVKNDALIPFLLGRRQCLGESLARETIFLFLTSIFQKFEVHPDPENPKPNFLPQVGFISFPAPFQVVMKEISHYSYY